jgi:hypothetical protein
MYKKYFKSLKIMVSRRGRRKPSLPLPSYVELKMDTPHGTPHHPKEYS